MKRLGWLIVFMLAVAPAWSAKKITVGQLEEMLRLMHQDKKSDADVSTALKQVELSEELTVSTMNSLVTYVPGPLSTEQIYVLEARSANLAPPIDDLPTTPVPDAATQQAILAKAATYVTKTYQQLPNLKASKTTLRFQDNVETVAPSSGLQNSATEVVTTAGFSNPASFVHYINSTEAPVVSEHGAEQKPAEKDKTPWGANRMIALQEPDPSLGVVLQEAQAAGSLKWLRWEMVNGKQAAVYTFEVPKKKSHMAMNVCCFPDVTQAGVARFYTATTASTMGGGGSGSGGGGVAGNMQSTTNWHNYKATVPYHGQLFIEPSTGVVVRMITMAELKPSEVVHQVDTRVDYGPVKVGDAMLIVPVKTVINTEVVPTGDSGSGGYTTRRTLLTSEYKNYQVAGGK
jgi:hypothetical protein